MFKSKFFFAVACVTLIIMISVIVMQIMEMKEFLFFE